MLEIRQDQMQMFLDHVREAFVGRVVKYLKQHRAEHVKELGALVWRMAGQDLVERRTEQIHIGVDPQGARRLADHLGGHVAGRAAKRHIACVKRPVCW